MAKGIIVVPCKIKHHLGRENDICECLYSIVVQLVMDLVCTISNIKQKPHFTKSITIMVM